MTGDRRRGPDGFAGRLVLAQLGVLVASVVTAAVVAAVVGPRLFHDHLQRARGSLNDDQVTHVERAYLDSSLLALGLAFVIAVGTAVVVVLLMVGRLRGPLEQLSSAARAISGGRYDQRVAPTGAGAELDELAQSFNEMAARLEATEETRRRLLADLAHEMRTPLATCSAYLEALDDEVAVWNAETSGVMRQQVTRLSRLAADLDDVSRAEEGRLALDRREVPTTRLVEAAVVTMRSRYADQGVHLETESSDGAAVVRVDAQRLGQVLTNLLDNALRHTPAHGHVRVRTRTEGYDAVVEVQDDGEGIAPEQLPHVFERFYRGDSARRRDRGSGIGLTISRAIVDAHGGTMTVRSAGPGHGTTVEVRLPRTNGAGA